jgi:hypothetical protein
MNEAVGSALLAEIYECAAKIRLSPRLAGRVGRVGDNGLTMHRREPFDCAARRLMKRTTMFLSRDRHIVPASDLIAGWAHFLVVAPPFWMTPKGKYCKIL